MVVLKSNTTGIKRMKVVLLGASGVGKTSLVQRYVHSRFSEAHKSTLGVKVDRKSVSVDGRNVALLLWDMHGEADGLEVPPNYLTGASAGLVVLDSTRPETADVALSLAERLLVRSPEARVYFVSNKTDLSFDAEALARALDGRHLLQTSAKSGQGVEDLFIELAQDLS